MRVPVRFLLVAGLATVGVVVAGVVALGGRDEPAPRPEPFATTALAGYDTSTAVVVRAPFCEAVDDRQVDAALGEVPAVQAWESGDEVDVGSGTADVVHEFGCRYATGDGSTAQAWVFAPPVDAAQAKRLARSAARAPGCVSGTEPAFGDPTLALTCTGTGTGEDAGTVSASFRGLFGDAWLVCEVSLTGGESADLVDRAGRWCVGVLQAASSGAPA